MFKIAPAFPAICAAMLLAWPGAAALAAADTRAGGLIFEEECGECHTVSGRHKKGPSLRGMLGRKAGSAPGFTEYSAILKKSRLVWTVEELDKYLRKPSQFSPSIGMKYEGMADAKSRADLIEFLATRK